MSQFRNYARSWKQDQRIQREAAAIRAMYWVLMALLLGAAMVIMASPARAEEKPQTGRTSWTDRTLEDPSKWIAGDTALQTVFLLTLAVDRGQTAYAASDRNPTVRHEEVGWARHFIGEHPTASQVNKYFAACGAAHTGITHLLIKTGHREGARLWQGVWIGAELNSIDTNVHAGISLRFR